MKKLIGLALSAALLSGSSSISVKRDYDESADFSGLETFAWQHAEQPPTGDPKIDNDINDDRIRQAVESALESKGYRPDDGAAADFQVAYFVGFKRKLNASSISFGMGGGHYGRYGGVGYHTAISNYEEGSLTIDIIDPAEEKTIWRGVGARFTKAPTLKRPPASSTNPWPRFSSNSRRSNRELLSVSGPRKYISATTALWWNPVFRGSGPRVPPRSNCAVERRKGPACSGR